MLTLPDQLLRNGLTLYSEVGYELDDAMRVATNPYIFSGHALFRPWLEAVEQHGQQNWIPDNCFRWVFTSVDWPRSSAFSRAVGHFLGPETTPGQAVSRALLNEERLATERKVTAYWCQHAEALYRPDEVLPYLPPIRYVTSSTSALHGLARWVASRVRYVTDVDNWERPDFWQPPGLTLKLGTGDCEDSSLVAWSAAPLLGLPTGRLALGLHGGQGHAWVEFPELNLFVEATTGHVGALNSSDFLAFYEPWLWAYADGSCESAQR